MPEPSAQNVLRDWGTNLREIGEVFFVVENFARLTNISSD